jgi:hypothetical protein
MAQVVPLLRKPYQLEYDLWVDDTEQDPNMRALAATALREALPMLSKGGFFVPEMLDILLPYLPWKVRQKMIAAVKAQSDERQQMAEKGINIAGRGQPRSPEELAARVEKIKSDTALHTARAQDIGHKAARDDFKAAVDAVEVMHQRDASARQHELDQGRHVLDQQRHGVARDSAAVKSLTELLSAIQWGQGGGEQ